MTKKLAFSILLLVIINTVYCRAQSDDSAWKLVFSTLGTNFDVTKEEFLELFNKSKNALLLSPYFDRKENYAPSTNPASKYNLAQINYQNEIDNIIKKISFKTIYKNDTVSDAYIKWDYQSRIFEDDVFGFVCKMDISHSRIFSGNVSYERKESSQLSKIDSVEVNYKYSYPIKIDSLQIDFSNLTSKKISSNIYLEKFSANGLILDIKNTEADEFIYLKAFDSKNNELYCRLYNDNKIPTNDFINEFAEYYSNLVADFKAQNNIDKAPEFQNQLDSLKFHSYLFSVPSKAKKIMIYFSKKRFEKKGKKFISNG